MFIQTEPTPNEHALKFRPGKAVLSESLLNTSRIFEFTSMESSIASPLARKLLTITGVKSVFFGSDFITVNKLADANWAQLKPDIYGAIMDFYASGQPVVFEEEHKEQLKQKTKADLDNPYNDPNANPEIVLMIQELLDSRIRPAVQDDGGDIEYIGFKNGIVSLKLKGSCRGCSSSTITLKSGIENMMKHYIPEVQSVEQVLDPEEEIAKQAFEEFEKKKEEEKERTS